MTVLSRRAAVAVLAGALLASGAAAQAPAAKSTTMEAAKLFKYLNLYYRIPAAQRSLFELSYFVETQGGPVRLSLPDGPVPLAADGKVLRLPTAAMLKEKAKVTLQAQPGTKFGLEMELEPTVRPAAEMPVAPLVASVGQANKGIKGAAGLVGGLVPTMARLHFKNAGSGQVELADGRKLPLQATAGMVIFDVNTPNARSLTFARAPSRIFMNPAPKPQKKK